MAKINIKEQLKGRTGTKHQGVIIKEIPIEDIEIKKNVRVKNEVEIKELAKSIKAVGLLQPISVIKTKDGHQCLMGHRRLLAYRELYKEDTKYHSIRAIITDDKNATIKQVTENIQRENLSAIELYETLKALKKEGYKLKEIAELLGKSLQTIKNWATITKEIDGNKALKKIIKGTAGSTYSDISETKRIKDEKQRIKAIKDRAKGKVTRDEIRGDTQAKGTAGSTLQKSPKKPIIKSNKDTMTISIKCHDKEQYKAIINRIKGV